MKVNAAQYSIYTANTPVSAVKEDEAPEEESLSIQQEEEARDVPAYIGIYEEKKRLLEMFKQTGGTSGQFSFQTERPKDNSSQLTRRLVAAAGQFEVRQIVADASGDMVKLRIALAGTKGKEADSIRQIIARLDKLLSRASHKIKDLDGEDLMKLRKVRAEKERQQKLAEQIKNELRKKKLNRMMREHGYLKEAGANKGDSLDPGQLDAAVEAEITAQAEAMAAAETSVASGGGATAAVEGGGGDSATSSGGEGGAEVASGEAAPAASE